MADYNQPVHDGHQMGIKIREGEVVPFFICPFENMTFEALSKNGTPACGNEGKNGQGNCAVIYEASQIGEFDVLTLEYMSSVEKDEKGYFIPNQFPIPVMYWWEDDDGMFIMPVPHRPDEVKVDGSADRKDD